MAVINRDVIQEACNGFLRNTAKDLFAAFLRDLSALDAQLVRILDIIDCSDDRSSQLASKLLTECIRIDLRFDLFT